MNNKVDFSIKPPKNFNDVRRMMQEYELNKKYIELGRDGKQCLLGFIWEGGGQCQKYQTLDYVFGELFADMLEERNKQIEKYLTENLNNQQ